MFFRRADKPSAAMALTDASPLAAGARLICDKAEKERWPLMAVAARSGHAVYWFAQSMLAVVEVHGRAPDGAEPVCLTKERIAGLTLTDDMASLAAADASPRYVDLQLTKAALQRYIAWAETVY